MPPSYGACGFSIGASKVWGFVQVWHLNNTSAHRWGIQRCLHLSIFPASLIFSLTFIVYVMAGNIQSGTRFVESCAHTVLVTLLYMWFIVPDLCMLTLPHWPPVVAVMWSNTGLVVLASATVLSRYRNERDNRARWIAADLRAQRDCALLAQ